MGVGAVLGRAHDVAALRPHERLQRVHEAPSKVVQSASPWWCHLSLSPLRPTAASHFRRAGLTDNHGWHRGVSVALAPAKRGREYARTAMQRKVAAVPP